MTTMTPTTNYEPSWARWLREWPLAIIKTPAFYGFSGGLLGSAIWAAVRGMPKLLIIESPILGTLILLGILGAVAKRRYRHCAPRPVHENKAQVWVRTRVYWGIRLMPTGKLIAIIMASSLASSAIFSFGGMYRIWPLIVLGAIMIFAMLALPYYGRLLDSRFYDHYTHTATNGS